MLSNNNLLNAQNAYITQLQNELDNLEERVAAQERENERLKEDNAKIKSAVTYENQILHREIDILKRQNSELLTLNRNQAQMITDLKASSINSSEIKALRTNNVRLQSQIDHLENNLHSAEAALIEKDKEIKSLKDTLLNPNREAKNSVNETTNKTIGTLEHYEDGKLVESHHITQKEADEFEKEFNTKIAAINERFVKTTSFLDRIFK